LLFHFVFAHSFPRLPGDESEVIAALGDVEKVRLAEGDMINLGRGSFIVLDRCAR
jgi:hypothetical protein